MSLCNSVLCPCYSCDMHSSGGIVVVGQPSLLLLHYRYKSLCPATWPNYPGNPKVGVEQLVKYLQYGDDDYRLGRYTFTHFFCRMIFYIKNESQSCIISALMGIQCKKTVK